MEVKEKMVKPKINAKESKLRRGPSGHIRKANMEFFNTKYEARTNGIFWKQVL